MDLDNAALCLVQSCQQFEQRAFAASAHANDAYMIPCTGDKADTAQDRHVIIGKPQILRPLCSYLSHPLPFVNRQ